MRTHLRRWNGAGKGKYPGYVGSQKFLSLGATVRGFLDLQSQQDLQNNKISFREESSNAR